MAEQCCEQVKQNAKPNAKGEKSMDCKKLMTAVGFEPTQLALVELESTPLDHSGKLSCLGLQKSG